MAFRRRRIIAEVAPSRNPPAPPTAHPDLADVAAVAVSAPSLVPPVEATVSAGGTIFTCSPEPAPVPSPTTIAPVIPGWYVHAKGVDTRILERGREGLTLGEVLEMSPPVSGHVVDERIRVPERHRRAGLGVEDRGVKHASTISTALPPALGGSRMAPSARAGR